MNNKELRDIKFEKERSERISRQKFPSNFVCVLVKMTSKDQIDKIFDSKDAYFNTQKIGKCLTKMQKSNHRSQFFSVSFVFRVFVSSSSSKITNEWLRVSTRFRSAKEKCIFCFIRVMISILFRCILNQSFKSRCLKFAVFGFCAF